MRQLMTTGTYIKDLVVFPIHSCGQQAISGLELIRQLIVDLGKVLHQLILIVRSEH